MKQKRRITAQLAKRGSKEEMEFNMNFWKQMDHEEKFSASWSMLDAHFLIRGHEGVTQRRLQRSIQNIKRRAR